MPDRQKPEAIKAEVKVKIKDGVTFMREFYAHDATIKVTPEQKEILIKQGVI
jgi:hypothetical protein